MIVGDGDTGYQQSGYQYYVGQPYYGNWTFAQANTCNECTPYSVFNYSSYAAGSAPYQFFTGPYGFQLESGFVTNTGAPYAILISSDDGGFGYPWQAEEYAEMGHTQSDVPGTSSSPVDFLAAKFEVNGTYGYGNYSAFSSYDENPSGWYLRVPPFAYSPDPNATDFYVYSYHP